MSAVPKLRFPEFDRDLKLASIGEFSTFSKGKGISKADISEDGALPCIRYGELYTHYGVRIDTIISKTDVPARELYLSEGGEVIVPASGETSEDISTASVVMHAGVALGGDLNIIKTSADGYFLASYISGNARNRLASMAQGNSVVHLYGKQIAGLEISLPSLPEQQKIASFLSSVDKKVDLLRQKKTELELYKKGLLQKIFSQEVRFKADDGSNFPDWKELTLGQVFTERSERGNGDKELLGVTLSRGVVRASEIDKIDRSSSDLSNYKFVKSGDIAYNSMRMWQGASGSSIYDGIVSPAYTVITPLAGNCVSYWSYLFKHDEMIKVFQRHSQGLTSDTWNLKFKALSTIRVQTPCGDEQQKIASFLSAIDSRIEKTSSQVREMETFKKGLLQQMFV